MAHMTVARKGGGGVMKVLGLNVGYMFRKP